MTIEHVGEPSGFMRGPRRFTARGRRDYDGLGSPLKAQTRKQLNLLAESG